MKENTVKIETLLLLPEVEDGRDGCLDRLESILQNKQGIVRAHFEREKTPVNLCLHYDADVLSLVDVRRVAERAGAKITNRYHHKVLNIEGMDCSDCALVVEHSLARLDGVLSANVNYPAQTLQVEYDSRQTSQRTIENRVERLGYRIPAEGVRGWYQERRKILFSLGGGLSLLVGWLGETYLGFPQAINLALYLAAYLMAGHGVAFHALGALRAKRFDTDILMVLAALGAATLGEFAEGGLLLFLFSMGHALEERTLDKARQAIRALGDMTPKTALVHRDGGELDVPVDSLRIGEIVIIKPGMRVPVDGEVLTGHSDVNQAPVTGESNLIEKKPGDQVFAGTVNGAGALEVKATRLARDSTLARVTRMVVRAQGQKAPTQRFADRFASYFVPLIIVADILLIAIAPFFGMPFRQSFLMGMTLLVAASPCALVLGTPAAVLAAVAHAARNGVLVKGGVHLENLGKIQVIAFDKTGTLTYGRPEVTDIFLTDPAIIEDDLLRLAAAVESRVAHPLADAIVRAARKRQLEIPAVVEAGSVTGQGAVAMVEGAHVWVGNLSFLSEQLEKDNSGNDPAIGQEIYRKAQNLTAELEAQGRTPILVGRDGELLGVIATADKLRLNAIEYVATLYQLGIQRTVLLTGDSLRVAQAVASQLGISEFDASLLPEEKMAAVEKLVNEYQYVAMVGDGVNDAPALASATVGIAMGGAGTQVALESADVALMADDLSKLPFAIGLGRATRAVIQQNLVFSLGVMAALVVLTLSGLAGIGAAIFIHEGSTLLVVLNALRLLSFQPRVVV